MTPEQRSIAVLERRIKLLRADLIAGLALGAGALPALIGRLELFRDRPASALQAGILLGLILVIVTNGLREYFANRRELVLREQDLIESLPPTNDSQ